MRHANDDSPPSQGGAGRGWPLCGKARPENPPPFQGGVRGGWFVAAAAFICAVAAMAYVPAQQVDHLQAFLLARGDDYFIHVLPAPPGHVLVYTIPSSGVMKPFFLAGPTADVAPHRSIAAVGDSQVRIIGLAADDERLYVAVRKRPSPGLSAAAVASDSPAVGTGDQFALYVFWQADASLLYEQPLEPPSDLTTLEPTLGRGPLRTIDGGVAAWGFELSFEGRTLTGIQTPDGRHFTPPPPDFSDRTRNY
jgi:hypothetical protein